MKIVAIDYGMKKIWTAYWDTKLGMCFPWELYKSKLDLMQYLKSQQADIIVIWIPKVNKWEKSSSLDNCLLLKKENSHIFSKSLVTTLDERMTTKIAKQKLNASWLSEKKSKLVEDSISALIILESYFNINDYN